jgi:hypothetical protein
VDGARDPKRSRALLREREPLRFAFVEAEKAIVPVAVMCRMLQVSAAG